MKHLRLFVYTAFAIILFSSCKKVIGEGPIITQERTTALYEGIEIYIPATVDYTEDTAYKLEIEAQQNILNITESYVSDNKLKLKFNHNNVNTIAPIKIHISAPKVNSFVISGSGTLYVLSSFHPENLKIILSGSCNMYMNELYTNNIDATVSGSGVIQSQAGTANNETLDISGSGTIDFLEVKAHTITTQSSGSGTMKVQADKSLHVTISGSGKVYYKGTPSVTTNISGSGSVIKL